MLSQDNIIAKGNQTTAIDKRFATGLFALTFGAVLLYFVGFAHSDILHNAAHDTRHAITAPCH